MKPSLIFSQYVWLVNTLRRYDRLTLEELNDKWMRDEVADGNPLSRSTFNRHRDAVLDMFGVIIECDAQDGYRYYIDNPEVLDDDSLERWMLNSLTVSSVLADSQSVHDRILLENVPAGEEHLQTLIKAIKAGNKVEVDYARFGHSGYKIYVAPYALKFWHQRWYLLASNDRYIITYALDRMRDVRILEQTFKLPADFSPAAYFNEFYGVLTDDSIPLQHVRIRAYGNTPNYLRTLPLHHSQKEVETTDEYTDFTLDIRPTFDFVGALGASGEGIEVLEPSALRSEVIEWHRAAAERYK
jgi:hypothetical protein